MVATADLPGAPSAGDTVCAICGGRRRVAGFHLTHGVVVQLCRDHRGLRYLARRGGRDFTAHLERAWRAHGVATATRLRALVAHRRRYGRRPPAVERPGSYSWPGLRREAERRFAAAEAPGDVIDDLRRRHADDVAAAPSVQTMRRWFREARWLGRDDAADEWHGAAHDVDQSAGRVAPAGDLRGATYRPPARSRWSLKGATGYDYLVPWSRMISDPERWRRDEDDFGPRRRRGP